MWDAQASSGDMSGPGSDPDIVITAKGLASGFPISAIAASTELMSKAWPGSQGGTYGGNAVAAAAGVATLGVIERENLVFNAQTRGEELRAGLENLRTEFAGIGNVRGLGLMQAGSRIHWVRDNAPDAATALVVQQAAIDAELLLLTCGPYGNVIRIIPALNVSSDEIRSGVTRFAQALKTAMPRRRNALRPQRFDPCASGTHPRPQKDSHEPFP